MNSLSYRIQWIQRITAITTYLNKYRLKEYIFHDQSWSHTCNTNAVISLLYLKGFRKEFTFDSSIVIEASNKLNILRLEMIPKQMCELS